MATWDLFALFSLAIAAAVARATPHLTNSSSLNFFASEGHSNVSNIAVVGDDIIYTHANVTGSPPRHQNESQLRNSSLHLKKDNRTELWLLGLFPFKGSWPGGLGQLPAVQMGLEDVNSDPNILPGYVLHMTINDTLVSTFKASCQMFYFSIANPLHRKH